MNDVTRASLDAARAAAENAPAGHYVPPAAGSTPTVFQPQAGAVAVAGPKGHKLAVSTMQSSGRNSLNVDNFLGVKPHGVIINFPNDDPRKATLGQTALQPLVLLLDYAHDVSPKYSCRAGVGQAIKFFHSYDRVVMDDGVTPWNEVVNRCMQSDPKCRGDYPSIDIAGTLLEPARLITGQEVLPAGKRVGFSTSVMNWKEYQALHQQLTSTDLVIEYDDNTMEGKVVIRVSGYVKANKGGIQYGAYKFECLGNGSEVAIPTVAQVQQPAGQAPAPSTAAAYNPAASAAAAPATPGAVPTGAYNAAGSTASAETANQTTAGPAGSPPPTQTAPGVIPGVAGVDTGAPNPKRRSRKAAGEAA